MTRFLLDTGMAADYINRRRGVYQRARDAVSQGHRLGIGLPVLAELWYGIENSRTRDRNAERLRRVLPAPISLWYSGGRSGVPGTGIAVGEAGRAETAWGKEFPCIEPMRSV